MSQKRDWADAYREMRGQYVTVVSQLNAAQRKLLETEDERVRLWQERQKLLLENQRLTSDLRQARMDMAEVQATIRLLQAQRKGEDRRG